MIDYLIFYFFKHSFKIYLWERRLLWINIKILSSEKIILPYCKINNKYSVAKMPLAKGFLSNNYKVGHKFADNERSNFGYDFNDLLLEKVENLFSKNNIKNYTSWALQEILKNDIDFAIPGVKNRDQLYSNLELF